MRGVILAGGLGSRLAPLTFFSNKHLLPIYNKPMIYYPIQTLVNAGINEIMIVVSGPHSGAFLPILKNGEDFGLKKLVYGYQEKPDGGIADALKIAEDFAEGGPIAVILGDNSTDSSNIKLEKEIYLEELKVAKKPLAKIFLKEVDDPSAFGVAKFESNDLVEIIEKPSDPPSSFAVTGLYFYDDYVFDFIRLCKPSKRGELEITDINNYYLKDGILLWAKLTGYWKDAGTFDSLLEANNYWAGKK